MKTAISIDAGLLQEPNETARLKELSRSRFFAMALRDFLPAAPRTDAASAE
jgi:metal-responsive CopG/Arc/MetJ family transcriptional regulator